MVDEAAATIGEKIEVRRLAQVRAAHVASYLHRTSPDLPPQIGVLVGTDVQTPLAREVAMHVSFGKPAYFDRESVPSELVQAERRIAEEKAREEGKPDQALVKIVEGRVNAFFDEHVLLEQKYAKDPKVTIGSLLQQAGVTATGFAWFRVGA